MEAVVRGQRLERVSDTDRVASSPVDWEMAVLDVFETTDYASLADEYIRMYTNYSKGIVMGLTRSSDLCDVNVAGSAR